MKDELHGLNVMVSKEMMFILYYYHLQILYFCHNIKIKVRRKTWEACENKASSFLQEPETFLEQSTAFTYTIGSIYGPSVQRRLLQH